MENPALRFLNVLAYFFFSTRKRATHITVPRPPRQAPV
jgi:hypothetical protein